MSVALSRAGVGGTGFTGHSWHCGRVDGMDACIER